MYTLCVICARTGSKGVKNKNFLRIKEKKLPSYASALKTQQMIQKIQKFKNEKN